MSLLLLTFISITLFSWFTLFALANANKLIVFAKAEPPYLFISDFTNYYAMSKLANSADKSIFLYDPNVQDQFVNQVISPFHTQKVFYGQYLPWFYCLVTPFTLLPHKDAFFVFNVVAVIFTSFALALLCKKVLNFNNLTTAVLVAAANAVLPAWQALFRGNSIYFFVGLVLLYCFGLFKRRDYLAGITLALTAYKPQFALLLSIPAFRYRRFKLLLAAFITEIILCLYAAFRVGINNVVGFPSILLTVEKNGNYDGIYVLQHINLRAFWAAYVSAENSMQFALISYLLAIGLLIWLWGTISQSNLGEIRWAMAITIIAALIFSPHALLYDVMLFIVAGVLTLPELRLAFSKNQNLTLAMPWFICVISYPFLSWYLHIIEPNQSPFQHELSACFNLLLLAFACAAYSAIKKQNLDSPS